MENFRRKNQTDTLEIKSPFSQKKNKKQKTKQSRAGVW
jgi:hypothetical protein